MLNCDDSTPAAHSQARWFFFPPKWKKKNIVFALFNSPPQIEYIGFILAFASSIHNKQIEEHLLSKFWGPPEHSHRHPPHAHAPRYRMHTAKRLRKNPTTRDLCTASTTPTIYSVSDSIVSFTPAPTPRSQSSLSHTHNIHTPTLPTPTLLTFTCNQVNWFLSRPTLTRPRASDVTTRPATSLTIISTHATQCV
jgi:hypothetical protein